MAAELELSEDAVKQRLSRGRKLLHEEVIAFVEGTLTRTAPGQQFSGAVLAALPLTTASLATAAAGATAKSSAATKLGFVGACLAPFITAHWLVIRSAPTERDRRAKKIAFTSLWIFVLLWCVVGQIAMHALNRHFAWSSRTWFSMLTGYWSFYAFVCVTMTIVMLRRFQAIREESQKSGEPYRPGMKPFKPANSAVVVAGTCLAFFSWLIWIAWRMDDRAWAGIIAVVMVAVGLWHFANLRGKTGLTVLREVSKHLALCWGAVLVILNLRLDVWMAFARGCTLADIHAVFPFWVTPSLTLALLLWAGLVLELTKPARVKSS